MPRGKQIVRMIELEECTIGQAKEEFYRHNKVKGLAPTTQKGYKEYVEHFANWCGNDFIIARLTKKKLDDYLYYKADKGVKAITLATVMVHIRTFLNFCISRGYMEKIEVTIPKYEKELKEPYTTEELQLLLARPKSNNWVEYRSWVMVNYFFSTGQRLSTVLNIKVKHLDLDNSRVKLIWNKDKIQKYMPLSTAMVKILKEYILVSTLHDEDYLFPEYEGNKLKNRSAEDAMADYNRSRGVSRTGIHLFRHTFAKNYIVNGGSPVKLQKLMNHKHIEQTMKYVNLYSTDISEDLDLFNPLDNFQKKYYTPMKRKTVIGA